MIRTICQFYEMSHLKSKCRLRKHSRKRVERVEVVVQFLVRPSSASAGDSGPDLKVEQRSQSPTNT